MSFIDIEVDHNSITALECILSKNSKIIFIAISSQDYPSLMIFNIGKKKKSVIHFKEVEKSTVIKQIMVSQNSKYCILFLQSTKVGSSVMYVEYHEEKVILHSVLKQKINMIAVNPNEPMNFIAVGPNYFRSYEMVDKDIIENHQSIVGAKYEKEYNFIAASFCQNRNTLIAIAEQNNVFVIEDKALKQFFHPLFDKRSLLIKHATIDDINNEPEEMFAEGKDDHMNELKKESMTGLKGFSSTDSKQKELMKRLEGTITINQLAVGTRLFAITTKCGARVGIYEIAKDFTINQIVMFAFPEDYTEVSKISISIDESYITFIGRQYSKIAYYENMEKVEELNDAVFENSLRNNCYVVNVAQLEAIKNDSLPVKEIIENGGPLGEILSIGVSQMKKQFITVGSDHMIRSWDYEEEYKQLIAMEVQESLYDISMHPMGLQFAIGQKEGLKIYYIMDTEFQVAAELGKMCCFAVKYSHGGQYLAAASGGMISIIDPYILEIKYLLEGHSANVTYLEWSDKDYYLVSGCKNNGSICCWQTKFEQYSNEEAHQEYKLYVTGKGAISGCCYDPDIDVLAVVTYDGYVMCYNDKNTSPTLEICYNDIRPTSAVLLKQSNSIIIGSDSGIIRVLNWPIVKHSEGTAAIEYHDIPSHASGIMKIACSEDMQTLFTVGKDSLIYLYNIKQYVDGLEITAELLKKQQLFTKSKALIGKIPTSFSVNSLVLVHRDTLEVKKQQIKFYRDTQIKKRDEKKEDDRRKDKEREDAIINLKEENKRQIHMQRTQYEDKKKDIEDHHKQELLSLLKKNEELKAEIDKLHLSYQAKLNKEIEKYNADSVKLKEMKLKYDVEIEEIVKKNKDVLESIQQEYSNKYKDLQTKYQKLVSNMKSDGIKFEEILEQCEQEYENEIQKMGTQIHYTKQNEQTARHKIDELEAKAESEKRKIKAQADEMLLKTKDLNYDVKSKTEINKTLQMQLNSLRERLIQKEKEMSEYETVMNDLRETNKHL